MTEPTPRRTPSPLVLGALLATGVLAGSLLRRASWRQFGLLAAAGAGVWHLLNRPRHAQSPTLPPPAADPVTPEPLLALPEWSDAPSFWVPFPQPALRDIPIAPPVIDVAEVESLSSVPAPTPIQPLMSVWQSLAITPPVTNVAEQAAESAPTHEPVPAPVVSPFDNVLHPELEESPAALFTIAEPPVVDLAPAFIHAIADEPIAADLPATSQETLAPALTSPVQEQVQAEPPPIPEFLAEAPPEPMMFPELDTRPTEPVLAKNDAWLLGLEPLPIIHPEPVWPQRYGYSHLAEGAILPDQIEIDIELDTPTSQQAEVAAVFDPELSTPSRSLLSPLFAVRADPLAEYAADSGPVAPASFTAPELAEMQPAMPPPAPQPVPLNMHVPAPVSVHHAMAQEPHVAAESKPEPERSSRPEPRPIPIKPIQPLPGAMATMPRSITWLDGELSRMPHFATRKEPAELVGATSAPPAHRRIVPRAPTSAVEVSADKKAWLNWWK